MNYGMILAALGGALATVVGLTAVSLLTTDDEELGATGRWKTAKEHANNTGKPVLVLSPVFPDKARLEEDIKKLKDAGQEEEAERLELVKDAGENGGYHEQVAIAAEYTRLQLEDQSDETALAELLAEAQKTDPFHAAKVRVAAEKKKKEEADKAEKKEKAAKKSDEGAEEKAGAKLQAAT